MIQIEEMVCNVLIERSGEERGIEEESRGIEERSGKRMKK